MEGWTTFEGTLYTFMEVDFPRKNIGTIKEWETFVETSWNKLSILQKKSNLPK